MSARDVIAQAIWLYERKIAGAPLPASWMAFCDNDPETAAIYETHAGSILSALAAAGFAVVPVVATEAMMAAGGNALSCERAAHGLAPTPHRLSEIDAASSVWSAMLTAAKEPHDD